MSFDPDNVAVLTGDIVKSTLLSRAERDALFAALKAGAASIAEMQGEDPLFERFSGDSWQMLVQPNLALRACLLLRAHIRQKSKAFETRISVGVGAMEPLSPAGLGASDGMAFQASGRGLKALRGPQYLTINTPLNPAFILADEISKSWSEKQAMALKAGLKHSPPSQKALADRLGISQQAVAKRLNSAGYLALSTALHEIETQPHKVVIHNYNP